MNPSTASAPASATHRRSILRHLPTVVRFLLGLPLVVFGLNGFLNFIPPPAAPLPAAAMDFLTALANTGYMLPLIAITHLTVGVLLVINRFVPLALALFAPFIVNSVAFHVALEPSGVPVSLVFLGFELYLAWCYRDAFRPMLAARTSP